MTNKTYTRYDLIKKTGITDKTITKYFQGKTKNPSEKNLILIADYLECTPDQVKDLIKKANKIELKINPYKKHLYKNGTYTYINWSRDLKISLDMFDTFIA